MSKIRRFKHWTKYSATYRLFIFLKQLKERTKKKKKEQRKSCDRRRIRRFWRWITNKQQIKIIEKKRAVS